MILPIDLTKPVTPAFGYVAYKAIRYCEVGRDIYRKGDFFHLPDSTLPDEILAAIDAGMRQLAEYRGMTREDPLTNLGIEGFYALMETLHFDLEVQSVAEVNKEMFLDKMEMKHRMSDMRITVYNRVERDDGAF